MIGGDLNSYGSPMSVPDYFQFSGLSAYQGLDEKQVRPEVGASETYLQGVGGD